MSPFAGANNAAPAAAEGLAPAVDERSRKGRGEHKWPGPSTSTPSRQRRSNTQPGASPPPPRAALHAQGPLLLQSHHVVRPPEGAVESDHSGRQRVRPLARLGRIVLCGSAAPRAASARESPTVRGCERESRCRPPARARASLVGASLFSGLARSGPVQSPVAHGCAPRGCGSQSRQDVADEPVCEQEVQLPVQGDDRRRLPHEGGRGGRAPCHDAGASQRAAGVGACAA